MDLLNPIAATTGAADDGSAAHGEGGGDAEPTGGVGGYCRGAAASGHISTSSPAAQ